MSRSYPRWQAESLKKALSKRRVLILAGPRQCGKTTLVKTMSDSQTLYHTLDDPQLLSAAQSDPRGFIRHGDGLMVIDEVQRAPILLQAIKQDVDENQKNGRFLLTGSANIQSLPGVTESLAGRVTKIRLRPLALGEIHGVQPHFLEQAFQHQFHSAQKEDKDHYISEAFYGGYPEARRLDHEKDLRQWYKDYINALIERDLKDIANIRRKDSMVKLIEVLAAWSSKFMNIASICTELSIQRPTV